MAGELRTVGRCVGLVLRIGVWLVWGWGIICRQGLGYGEGIRQSGDQKVELPSVRIGQAKDPGQADYTNLQ